MAEALAVVGLVASVVQFVDFSTRIIERLNDFRSAAENGPNVFQAIHVQLRLLRSNLERTVDQAAAGQLDDKTLEDVNAVVEACHGQLQRVKAILDKLDSVDGESRWRRGVKVLLSVYQEDEIREITRTIQDYVSHLIHHQTLSIQATLATRPVPQRSTSFSTVPYPRDPYFAGRKDQLTRLHDLLQNGNRAALCGLGGIGKNQIAIEYCHQFQEIDPGAIVLWVYASSIARIEQDYQEIARKARLRGYDDPNKSKLKLVSDWLEEDASGSWLLIIDNADLEKFFIEPIDKALTEGEVKLITDYIPTAPNGKALITSRSRDVATRFTHRSRVVEVPNLTLAEGRKLLENAVGEEKLEDDDEVLRLLSTLEYLPLAISQAAAYIEKNQITIARYLRILEADDHAFIEMLDENMADARRDRESLNSVIASWKLSFDYLRAQKPEAAKMLSLMSMLDGKSIPEGLLISQHPSEKAFCDAVGVLKTFSLVQENSKKQEYTVHRLIHLATRTWIEQDGVAASWHKQALESVNKAFPAGKVTEWSECTKLEPHVEAVLTSKTVDTESRAQMAELLYRSARDRYHQRRSDTAFARCRQALAIRRDLSADPAGDLPVAQCLQLLSWCHFAQGDHPSAIVAAEQALSIYSRLCSDDSEECLRARSNLSKFLTKNGELARAYTIQVAVHAQQTRTLGTDHADTLFTMGRMATTLRKQRRYPEALQVSEVLVAGRRRAFGDQDHYTLDALSGLGMVLFKLGRVEDALAAARTVYEGQRRLLGADHATMPEYLGMVEEYERELEKRVTQLDPGAVVELQEQIQRELVFQPVLASDAVAAPQMPAA